MALNSSTTSSTATVDRPAGGGSRRRRTLAHRLFVSVFLSFLGFGAVIAGILIWDVLQRAEAEVKRELLVAQHAFQRPIADQIWAYDRKELQDILAAMVQLAPIEGVAVYDPPSGQRIGAFGTTAEARPGSLDSFTFAVHYLPAGSGAQRHVGDVVVATRPGLALQRSWRSIALIVLTGGVKLALIWVLFGYFARRLLSEPLGRLTEAVKAVDPTRPAGGPVDAVGGEDGELKELQTSFNGLLGRLENAHAQRAAFENEMIAAREGLEASVRERTRELEAARRGAENANLAKSRFLAMMSHELRTPLNSIIGFSQVMTDEVLGRMENARYREYAANIRHSATHLVEVIGDILELSKAEDGAFALDEADIDLAEVAGRTARLLRPRIDAKGQTLGIDFAPGLARLHADERAIGQALLNLVSNANKFTPEGGHLWIRGRDAADGGIVVTVADDGAGIAAKDIPRVLEAFGQAAANPQIAQDGTGLGLTLSKRLVELHGGSLTVESEPGAGTRVVMHFPPDRAVR